MREAAYTAAHILPHWSTWTARIIARKRLVVPRHAWLSMAMAVHIGHGVDLENVHISMMVLGIDTDDKPLQFDERI